MIYDDGFLTKFWWIVAKKGAKHFHIYLTDIKIISLMLKKQCNKNYKKLMVSKFVPLNFATTVHCVKKLKLYLDFL